MESGLTSAPVRAEVERLADEGLAMANDGDEHGSIKTVVTKASAASQDLAVQDRLALDAPV